MKQNVSVMSRAHCNAPLRVGDNIKVHGVAAFERSMLRPYGLVLEPGRMITPAATLVLKQGGPASQANC